MGEPSQRSAGRQPLHDFRGFSGQIAGGIIKVGQKVMALPAGLVTTVKEIHTLNGPLQEAFSPQSVTLVLFEHRHRYQPRFGMIVDLEQPIGAGTGILHAKVCWMHPRPLQRGKKYFLKHTSHTVQVVVTDIVHRLNIEDAFDPETLRLLSLGDERPRGNPPAGGATCFPRLPTPPTV